MGAIRMFHRLRTAAERNEKRENLRRAARWYATSAAKVARNKLWWSRWLSVWRRIGARAARDLTPRAA